jgi:hypothetical protein
MKNLILKTPFITLLFVLTLALQSFIYDNEADGALVTWIESQFDFGVIKQGIPVEHYFEFKNDGDAPLLINNVKTSCGCTVSSFPQEPIMPGESEKIIVTYNAAKVGKFNKIVTVFSNDSSIESKLSILGEVSAK